MRKSKFSDEQIIGILKEAEAGPAVTDVCRQRGISAHTFYRWRSKYGGLEVNEVRRLKEIEDENRELKQMVADQALQSRALKAAMSKNGEPCTASRVGRLLREVDGTQRALVMGAGRAQSIAPSSAACPMPRSPAAPA